MRATVFSFFRGLPTVAATVWPRKKWPEQSVRGCTVGKVTNVSGV